MEDIGGRKERRKKNPLADGILEIGSILTGKELTIKDAKKRFLKINSKKQKLVNGERIIKNQE
jgi:hypothetical protein